MVVTIRTQAPAIASDRAEFHSDRVTPPSIQAGAKCTVTIKMLNEEHAPIITWQLENAWAKKIQSTDLKADANEVAIETMELAHEGLTILEAS